MVLRERLKTKPFDQRNSYTHGDSLIPLCVIPVWPVPVLIVVHLSPVGRV